MHHDKNHPDPLVVADADDELDWDVTRHGRMRDQATADDAVPTVRWEG